MDTQTKHMTIRWTLPLCAVVPLISGIFLTGWLAFRSGQQAVEALVNEVSTEVAANIEKEVTSYLTRTSMVSAAFSAEVASGSIDIHDTSDLRQTLWQLTRSDLVDQTLAYGNESGEFVYSHYQDGQSRIDVRDETTGFRRTPYYTDNAGNLTQQLPESEYDKESYNTYDPRKRDWYKNAVATKAIAWSDVYIAKGIKRLTLTHSTPILNSAGQVQGVFGVDVYLFELSNFLKDLAISPNAHTFVIETSGTLIAASSEYGAGEYGAGKYATDQAGANQEEVALVAAVDSPNPLISTTAHHLLERFGDFDQADNQYAFTFEVEGEKQLAHVYRLQALGIDWLVGVTIPQSDYMGNINETTRRTLLIGLAVTGIASLLSLAASLYIIHPINKLTQAAIAIKNNQFSPDDLAEIIARPDEFSELANLFNDMAIVVVSREQSLAEQVKRLETEIGQQGGRGNRRHNLETLLKRAAKARQAYIDR